MANRDGSKSGGRSKGTPNKKTTNAQEIADRLGVDPFEVLLRFAAGDWKKLGYTKEKRLVSSNQYASIYEDNITPSIRASAAAQACKYLYPQRKAVELKGEDGKMLPTIIVSLPSNGRERKD
jgi:hypothetical protein